MGYCADCEHTAFERRSWSLRDCGPRRYLEQVSCLFRFCPFVAAEALRSVLLIAPILSPFVASSADLLLRDTCLEELRSSLRPPQKAQRTRRNPGGAIHTLAVLMVRLNSEPAAPSEALSLQPPRYRSFFKRVIFVSTRELPLDQHAHSPSRCGGLTPMDTMKAAKRGIK